MIRYGKSEEIVSYFETNEISQSYLKNLIKGVAYIGEDEKKLYYSEKGSLIIGSAVDCLISEGEESFNKQYHVSKVEKPSDTMISIIHHIFDNIKEEYSNFSKRNIRACLAEIINAIEVHNYQPRWKQETKVNKVIELGELYFMDLQESYGKTVLSKIQNEIITNIHMSWTSNIYTADYFKSSLTKHIFYQVPIFFSYKGVDCKVLLDMVVVDTETGSIEPIDFKTMAETTDKFTKSFRRFRYDFQGGFYSLAIIKLLEGTARTIEELTSVLSKLKVKPELKPFKFMVETTSHNVDKMTGDVNYHQGSPLMYELSEESYVLGINGRPEVIQQVQVGENQFAPPIRTREILGVNQALDLYIWHLQNGFEADRKVVESKGIISI